MRELMRMHHVRLMCMHKELLPDWKKVFSNYDVMAEGKDPLGPIYAQMIDSVLADQTIDHDGLVQVCDDAVKAESEGNWLKFESTDPNYLEVQYAASFEMSLKELDGWLMEHLVKKLLTRP